MMWLLIGAGVCVVFLAGFLTCAVLAVGARADECAKCERTMAAAVKAGTAVAMDDILMLMGGG